jgi:HSP20 family protein
VDNEGINAEYTDGLLKVNVAKKEETRTASRQIEIK